MYILEFLFAVAFILAFRYFSFLQLKNVPLWVMPTAFIVKIATGIVFLIIYLHPNSHNSVPSDTMRFLSESKTLHDIFYTSPKDYFTLLSGIGDDTYLIDKYLSKTFLWDSGSLTIVNDSRNIIRLHSLIHFISFGSPFIHTLFMCFIALAGLRHIYISFEPYISIKPVLTFFILLLFPSALFWSSGILKEPILLFGVGLLLRSLLTNDSVKKRIIYGTISIILLISIKPYVLFCLIPSILFYLLYTHLFNKRLLVSLIAFFCISAAGIFIFKNKTQKVVKFISMKQFDFTHIGKGGLYVVDDSVLYFFEPKNYKNIKIDHKKQTVTLIYPSPCIVITVLNKIPERECILYSVGTTWPIKYYIEGAQSYIKTTPINNSPVQLIKNIPEALMNAYARPFPKDPGSFLRFPAMIEIWGLTLFLLISLFYRRTINPESLGLIVSILIFSFFLLIVVGWTTPVIGAIFRYRFPAFFALLLMGLIIIKIPKRKLTDG